MTVPAPADVRPIQGSCDIMEEVFKVCKAEKCDFVFFVTSDAITNLHSQFDHVNWDKHKLSLFSDFMKRCEQRFGIVSQDLKMNNADEIVNRGKQETMINIISKTNIKLGGLNYSVTVSDYLLITLSENR